MQCTKSSCVPGKGEAGSNTAQPQIRARVSRTRTRTAVKCVPPNMTLSWPVLASETEERGKDVNFRMLPTNGVGLLLAPCASGGLNAQAWSHTEGNYRMYLDRLSLVSRLALRSRASNEFME